MNLRKKKLKTDEKGENKAAETSKDKEPSAKAEETGLKKIYLKCDCHIR